MQAAPQLRVEDLLSQLPGTLRRGYVPEDPGRDWGTEKGRGRPGDRGGRLSTGCPEVDELLGGGVPRGRLSELISRGSAGATSLVQRLLSGVTTNENLAAWVDLADAFDPASASAAGVALHRLLWVRPPDLVAAFAATEILLKTGGFALVLLDVSRFRDLAKRISSGPRKARSRRGRGVGKGAEAEKGRRMLSAPQTWLRLARAAEQSQTALVVLGQSGSDTPRTRDVGRDGWTVEPVAGLAGAAAGVRLELSTERAVWEGAPGSPPLLEGLVTRVDVTRNRGLRTHGSRSRRTHLCLGAPSE